MSSEICLGAFSLFRRILRLATPPQKSKTDSEIMIRYLCFVAYPIVFTGIRGWSVGMTGLAFTGLAVGELFLKPTPPNPCRILVTKYPPGVPTFEANFANQELSSCRNADSEISIGCFLVIGTEPLLRRMINSHKKDPETGKVPPEAMVSVVCIAAVLAPVGELWFAWTCVPPVHWIWPILAGIPFGAGNTAVFIYASNYLAHSYGSEIS